MKKNIKLEAIKAHIRRKKQQSGRKIPNYKKEFDYERRLKMTAVEGITKLFNVMSQVQKETLDDIIKQGITETLKKPMYKFKKHKAPRKKEGVTGKFLGKEKF